MYAVVCLARGERGAWRGRCSAGMSGLRLTAGTGGRFFFFFGAVDGGGDDRPASGDSLYLLLRISALVVAFCIVGSVSQR